MKKIWLLALLWAPLLFATNNDINLEALKEWIATKRAVTVEERGGALSISGDVRVEYIAISESENGVKNIGLSSNHPLFPEDQFDVEFNLLFDYRTEKTWTSIQIEFDNDAGIINANFNSLSLQRAFLGVRLYENDESTTDLEFGRRFLGYSFDSQIQFGALMDGVLLKYNRSMSNVGDFYLLAAPFIVNERIFHVSFVTEIGLLNIANTGFYAKYSLIDWATRSFSNESLNRAYSYINNQFLLGYRFTTPFLNASSVIYAAFLVNAAAKPFALLDNQLDNLAGYIGMQMGEIRKRSDWSLDLCFQIVEPQAIPFQDFSGIGITNPDGVGLFTLVGNDASGTETLKETLIANGNYYGFKLDFLYAIEDSLTLAQSFSISRPNVSVAKKFDYQRYKIELIYAW